MSVLFQVNISTEIKLGSLADKSVSPHRQRDLVVTARDQRVAERECVCETSVILRSHSGVSNHTPTYSDTV